MESPDLAVDADVPFPFISGGAGAGVAVVAVAAAGSGGFGAAVFGLRFIVFLILRLIDLIIVAEVLLRVLVGLVLRLRRGGVVRTNERGSWWFCRKGAKVEKLVPRNEKRGQTCLPVTRLDMTYMLAILELFLWKLSARLFLPNRRR